MYLHSLLNDILANTRCMYVCMYVCMYACIWIDDKQIINTCYTYIAHQYLARGSKVTVVARSQSKLDAVKAALQSTDLQTYSVDVGESQEAVVAAFQKIVEAFGEVDVLVNCAGTSISGRIMRSI